MSKPISTGNKNFYQGLFSPKNPHKYAGDLSKINYKSNWEKKFMIWADGNPDVLAWASEPVPIPYWSKADNKMRKYFIDFIIKVNTNSGIKIFMVEIKPSKQTVPPKVPKNPNKMSAKNHNRMLTEQYTFQVNQDKWDAAREEARKRGWEFLIITEKELNVR